MKKQKNQIEVLLFDVKRLQFLSQENRLLTFHQQENSLTLLYDLIKSITGRTITGTVKYSKFRDLATLAWHMLLEKDIVLVNQVAQKSFNPKNFQKLFEANQTVKFAAW